MLSSLPPSDPKLSPEPGSILFSRGELAFEKLVTRAILQSLDVDQILYIVLSGVTSGEGLGFNRGLFLLADEGERWLRARMAIGPMNRDQAKEIWEDMELKELALPSILSAYETIRNEPQAHQLAQRLQHIAVPLQQLGELSLLGHRLEDSGEERIEPILAKCLMTRTMLASNTLDLRCEAAGEDPLRLSRWWMAPLVSTERLVGALVVDDAFTPREVSPSTQHLLEALADLSAIAIEKGKLFAELKSLAEVDGLTGISNRRTYERDIEELLTRSRQTGRPLSLVLLDVDHFKDYNDSFGHLAGDDVLRLVGRILRSRVRPTDRLARYGGEEFVVLLPDTGHAQALASANHLLHDVLKAGERQALPARLTLSAGVATFEAGDCSARSLFERADEALYEAKRSGRNRAVSQPPRATSH